MKKALIISPYLDHVGGGERYMLTVASVLESLSYEIYFAWDNLDQIDSLREMLGVRLKNPQLDTHVKSLYFSKNPLAMYLATRPYDVVVHLSDGSLPLLGGKRNIVHIQVPFHGVSGSSWQNELKKRTIDEIIVNSRFTKSVIDREYHVNSLVVYPPVVPVNGKASKEKIILSVGRFEPSLNIKRQDVLIEAFKKLSAEVQNWKLVLAGGSSSESWVQELKKKAKGLPVEFAVNVSHTELTERYKQATIYWHAAGFGVNEVEKPELTEHFGMSTVEAISAGCIPLVVPYGGQREIVANSNYHWESIDDLVKKTMQQIKTPINLEVDIEQYGVENFKKQFENILL